MQVFKAKQRIVVKWFEQQGKRGGFGQPRNNMLHLTICISQERLPTKLGVSYCWASCQSHPYWGSINGMNILVRGCHRDCLSRYWRPHWANTSKKRKMQLLRLCSAFCYFCYFWALHMQHVFSCYSWKFLYNSCFKKNPAYGRHQLSRPMRIVGPIQIWRGCMVYLFF